MHTKHLIAAYKYVVVGLLSMFVMLGSIAIVSAQPDTICRGICDLAWSSVEEDLLGAVDEFGLWLYDISEANNPPQFFPHEYATSLSFDPTGRYIAVISCPNLIIRTDPCNGLISLFDIQEESWTALKAYNYNISNVNFTPNGRYIAFEKDARGALGIEVIDLTKNNTLSIVNGPMTNAVIDYAFDRQSNYIAVSNGAFGTEGHAFWGISLWSLSDQTYLATTEGSRLAAALTFTETDNDILFITYDAQMFGWKYQTGDISTLGSFVENAPFDNLHRLSFSQPPTYLLAALIDGEFVSDRKLFVWDIQSGDQVFFRDMPEDSFTDLITINSTGEYIAYSSTINDGKLIDIWERATGSTRQVEMRQQ